MFPLISLCSTLQGCPVQMNPPTPARSASHAPFQLFTPTRAGWPLFGNFHFVSQKGDIYITAETAHTCEHLLGLRNELG